MALKRTKAYENKTINKCFEKDPGKICMNNKVKLKRNKNEKIIYFNCFYVFSRF